MLHFFFRFLLNETANLVKQHQIKAGEGRGGGEKLGPAHSYKDAEVRSRERDETARGVRAVRVCRERGNEEQGDQQAGRKRKREGSGAAHGPKPKPKPKPKTEKFSFSFSFFFSFQHREIGRKEGDRGERARGGLCSQYGVGPGVSVCLSVNIYIYREKGERGPVV